MPRVRINWMLSGRATTWNLWERGLVPVRTIRQTDSRHEGCQRRPDRLRHRQFREPPKNLKRWERLYCLGGMLNRCPYLTEECSSLAARSTTTSTTRRKSTIQRRSAHRPPPASKSSLRDRKKRSRSTAQKKSETSCVKVFGDSSGFGLSLDGSTTLDFSIVRAMKNPWGMSTMKYRPDFPGRFGCIEDD